MEEILVLDDCPEEDCQLACYLHIIDCLIDLNIRLEAIELTLLLSSAGASEEQLPDLLHAAAEKGLPEAADTVASEPRRENTCRAGAAYAIYLLEHHHSRTLTATERRMLCLLYGLEDGVFHSEEDTARILGVTQKAVSNRKYLLFSRASRVYKQRHMRKRFRDFYAVKQDGSSENSQ